MNLFTYGTLMAPDIMEKVAGSQYRGVEAMLEGFRRFRVNGEQYPGIISFAEAHVAGVLYCDIGSEALARLDRFEGEMYSREPVVVISKKDGVAVEAMTYVFKAEYQHLLTAEAWDFQHFLQIGKKEFENGYGGYRQLQEGE